MTSALKWRIAIGLVLIFCAGLATGAFLGAWRTREVFIGHHAAVGGERMRRHFERQLDLTPEQLKQAEPILNNAAARLQEIRMETGKRVAETMEQSRRELMPHLTPEQQARLDKMKERHLRRMHGRHRREHRAHDRP